MADDLIKQIAAAPDLQALEQLRVAVAADGLVANSSARQRG